jgi:hypothetical protein
MPRRPPQSTARAPIRRYRPKAGRIFGTTMPSPVGADRKMKAWWKKR